MVGMSTPPADLLTLDLPDTWLPLRRSPEPLQVEVALDDSARNAAAAFDYTANGTVQFYPWMAPHVPDQFCIGVIVGGSGSGKSTLLRSFGEETPHEWRPDKCIADHFPGDDVAERFYAVGLSSVPTWLKPYRVLSNGERFRADLARSMSSGAVIDEFTSVVDRNVARAASRSFGKFARSTGLRGIVVATVHRDILSDLQPDWVIDTDAGMWATRPKECLHRSEMVADVYEVDRSMWSHFMDHHYLTHDLHPFARCYLAAVHGTPVAFAAAIPFPHGHIRNAWRGTRLVTLPDFQGLGVGPRLADWVAEAHHRAGYNYYTKTTHPRLGRWRDESPAWRNIHGATSTKTPPASFGHRRGGGWVGSARRSYSHQFIGATQ